ncbi:hypothetical protein CH296_18955 [Rhodococcus sp. 14-2496-1d]|nr:hypothetical protein CH296_18955 [Rhodococcus sp. 14-2496-1d]
MQRNKAWILVGILVLVGGAVIFWGVNRESDKADAQESVMKSSCERSVNLKLYGLTSQSRVDVVDISYDRSSAVVSGTFRDGTSTNAALYTFRCSGINTVEYERVQGN